MFECEKIWRICGGDVLFPHFPAIPDTLFSRKIPKIFPFLGEIHSKPTINDTKTWVKYRFGHRIGDAIGGVGFCHFGHKPISASGKSERSRWYTSVPCRRDSRFVVPPSGCPFCRASLQRYYNADKYHRRNHEHCYAEHHVERGVFKVWVCIVLPIIGALRLYVLLFCRVNSYRWAGMCCAAAAGAR